MDRIKDLTGLPFMLKGVQTAEDAEIAVQHGVDYIWVSNHGGRQIDHGLAAWTRCPRSSQAVRWRADRPRRRACSAARDILKAVALGADVVALGRMQALGPVRGGTGGRGADAGDPRGRAGVGDGPVGVDLHGPGDAQVRVPGRAGEPAHEMSRG